MKIKVILLEEIKGVGKKDEIVEVKDGYANNFLFSNKKAILANEQNLKKLEQKKEKVVKDMQKEIDLANKLKDNINEKTVKLYVKAGENGKVFGSISAKEIIDCVRAQLKIELEKKVLEGVRVKKLGTHKLELKLHKNVKAFLNLIVEGN